MITTLTRSDGEMATTLPGTGPRFLLTRPDFYSIEYAINPFMDEEVQVDHARALDEWEAWYERLVRAGARVEIQEAANGCPDLVFGNNAALVLDGRALLSRFRYPERRAESPHNRATLEQLGITVDELPPAATAFEGAACAMPFNGRLIAAYGTRTTSDAIEHVAAWADLQPIPVELPDPRFYHLDVALCILDRETVLVVPDAMTPHSWQRLRAVVPNPIEVTLEEGLLFCANAVCVDRTVFMHRVPDRLGTVLQAHGFEPVESPVGEFLKSGGSLACMSLRLDRTAS